MQAGAGRQPSFAGARVKLWNHEDCDRGPRSLEISELIAASGRKVKSKEEAIEWVGRPELFSTIPGDELRQAKFEAEDFGVE